MVDLCGNYERGMGIFCPTEEGPFLVFTPWKPLFGGVGNAYLRLACAEDCWCMMRREEDDVRLAAHARDVATGFLMLDQFGDPYPPGAESDDEDNYVPHADAGWDALSEVASQYSLGSMPSYLFVENVPNHPPPPSDTVHIDPDDDGIALSEQGVIISYAEGYYVDPLWQNGVLCNADFLGEPDPRDCAAAMNLLQEEVSLEDYFVEWEFTNNASQRRLPGTHDVFQLPWIRSVSMFARARQGPSLMLTEWKGTCSYAIQLLPWEHEQYDSENFDYVEARANAIQDKCVSPRGVGGWAKAGM